MKKLLRFVPRGKGHLTKEEHDKCSMRLGKVYFEMLRLMACTKHVLSGRIQSYRDKDCPCVYVFYSAESFRDNQSGLMYIMQDLEDRKGFEIVFREWKGQIPLSKEEWARLTTDDRYNVCSNSNPKKPKYPRNWKWRAFQVRTEKDFAKARELVGMAKEIYEQIFEI